MSSPRAPNTRSASLSTSTTYETWVYAVTHASKSAGSRLLNGRTAGRQGHASRFG